MTAPRPTYRLGAVLPHVRTAAEAVGWKFGLTSILGWRATARDMSGHPAGRALDFMTTREQGDQVAEFLLANAEALGVEHVIWRQRYREPGKAWEPMEDRGSPTQNHMDHVHAKFRLTAPGGHLVTPGGVVDRAGDVLDAVNPLAVFDGWRDDLTGVGIKLAVAGAALALFVVGLNRTVTPPGGNRP